MSKISSRSWRTYVRFHVLYINYSMWYISQTALYNKIETLNLWWTFQVIKPVAKGFFGSTSRFREFFAFLRFCVVDKWFISHHSQKKWYPVVKFINFIIYYKHGSVLTKQNTSPKYPFYCISIPDLFVYFGFFSNCF